MGCDHGPNPFTDPDLFYHPKGGRFFNVYDRPSLHLRKQVAAVYMQHLHDPPIQLVRSRWVKVQGRNDYVCVYKVNVFPTKNQPAIYGVWVEKSELARIGRFD